MLSPLLDCKYRKIVKLLLNVLNLCITKYIISPLPKVRAWDKHGMSKTCTELFFQQPVHGLLL